VVVAMSDQRAWTLSEVDGQVVVFGRAPQLKPGESVRVVEAVPGPFRVELCPVCQRSNIAGRKFCYGGMADSHEKTMFEFVPVIPLRGFVAVENEGGEALDR
jgi:hypothetical protein